MDCILLHVIYEDGLSILVLKKRKRKLEFKNDEFLKGVIFKNHRRTPTLSASRPPRDTLPV
jgi:hypothetical protein